MVESRTDTPLNTKSGFSHPSLGDEKPLMSGALLSSFTVASPAPVLPALSETRNFTLVTPSLVIVTWLFEAEAALQVAPL
jgi:hypothetical protein